MLSSGDLNLRLELHHHLVHRPDPTHQNKLCILNKIFSSSCLSEKLPSVYSLNRSSGTWPECQHKINHHWTYELDPRVPSLQECYPTPHLSSYHKLIHDIFFGLTIWLLKYLTTWLTALYLIWSNACTYDPFFFNSALKRAKNTITSKILWKWYAGLFNWILKMYILSYPSSVYAKIWKNVHFGRRFSHFIVYFDRVSLYSCCIYFLPNV